MSSRSGVSTGRRMPSPFAELLADLSACLSMLGARWYLFGAQAALVHDARTALNAKGGTYDDAWKGLRRGASPPASAFRPLRAMPSL